MKTTTQFKNLSERYIISSNGVIYDLKRARVIKNYKISTGYYVVHLQLDGEYTTKNLHRLVAETFLQNDDPKNKVEVAHLDDNKENNCISNLKWSTKKENRQTPRGKNPLDPKQKEIFKRYYNENRERIIEMNSKYAFNKRQEKLNNK